MKDILLDIQHVETVHMTGLQAALEFVESRLRRPGKRKGEERGAEASKTKP